MRPAALILAAAAALLCPGPARAAGPVLALLDPGKDPRAALLEAKLLADPGVTLVKRAGVDQVLKEQQLQALFGPQGVGDRVKLGRLLKADLLVMVRAVRGATEPALEVVVSETAGGLRLAVRGVPVSNDAAADAAALLAVVREGVRKAGENVTGVVAVPPFVSNDLTFEADHLKAAYAKLAEGVALGRPGVVAVELAEAEALARELPLADPGGAVRRPPPIYLLGEYRHAGPVADRTVSLKLRTERAGKPIGEAVAVTVKAAGAPAVIRQWAADAVTVASAGGGAARVADSKAEARQLADRARVFRRLAQWPECLALVDASLLLDPDQVDLHADAVRAIAALSMASVVSGGYKTLADVQRAAHLHRRGIDHLAAFDERGGDRAKYRDAAGGDALITFYVPETATFFTAKGVDRKQVDEVVSELRRYDREVSLRLIPILADRNKHVEVVYIGRTVFGLPPREKYELLEKIIELAWDRPNATTRTVRYVTLGSGSPADTPEYRAFLRRLAGSKDANVRAAAAELERGLEAARKGAPFRYSTDPNPQAPGAAVPDGVKLQPVPLTVVGPGRPPRPFLGVIAAGPGADVVWTADTLYLMKEKGKLRVVWEARDAGDAVPGFATVCFDGRYVWAALPRSRKSPTLLVLDPGTEKVWDASAADGLPQVPQQETGEGFTARGLIAAPLEPGRACLVGSFFGRCWVGVARFDAASGKVGVTVVHEAREAADLTDKDQWARTTVAFNPLVVATLTGPAGADGKPVRRVLVGRTGGARNLGVADHPLLIDPDRPSAEVLADRVWACRTQDQCAAAGGAVYFVEPTLERERRTHIARIGFPEVEKGVVAKSVVATGLAPSEGHWTRVVAHAGLIHAVLVQTEITPPEKGTPGIGRPVTRYQWWTVDASGTGLRHVASGLPPIRSLGISSHYGLVALTGEPYARSSTLNVVTLTDPPTK